MPDIAERSTDIGVAQSTAPATAVVHDVLPFGSCSPFWVAEF
jgi:hypothetical protein